jgi:nicotinate-nucleotide pyrophosphorylase (carboxylating)
LNKRLISEAIIRKTESKKKRKFIKHLLMLDFIIIDPIIRQALAEDIGTGDITTNSVVPEGRKISGQFIAKQQGVICGLKIVERVFHLLDPEVVLTLYVADGDKVQCGDIIAAVSGPAKAVLTGERVGLNFLQRLSGISTRTRQLVDRVSDTPVKILDTRKTTPGLRILEKYAVRMGGGNNHRTNLSDGLLIKDNHIKAAGSITAAVEAAKNNAPRTLKIEVEVENLDQVNEALRSGADIIMLDNMDLETMRQAVSLINGRALVEASGNMDQKDLLEVARTGVDMISMGGLTHSVQALDISLKLH